jgi:hypothetical protein
MFDTTTEMVIEGTVWRFDWVNPHIYIIVATKGPDGAPALVEGEGVGITQALVDGFNEDPDFLTAPAALTESWDHRPNLEFSQDTEACDP